MRSPRGQAVSEALVSVERFPLEETAFKPHSLCFWTGGESISRRRKRVCARGGKIRTDSKPAAMNTASVAFVIKLSSLPIWVSHRLTKNLTFRHSPNALYVNHYLHV